MLQIQPPTASQPDQQPLSPTTEMYEDLQMMEAADAAAAARAAAPITRSHGCKFCSAIYSRKSDVIRHIKVLHIKGEKMKILDINNEVFRLKPDGRKRCAKVNMQLGIGLENLLLENAPIIETRTEQFGGVSLYVFKKNDHYHLVYM